MGNFFPDFGEYDTGNPLLDIISGRAKKREEGEERDPFDPEDWAQEEPAFDPEDWALPEGEDAAAAPPAPEVRTLQKRELINKERRKKKEAEAKAKGAAPAEEP